MINDAKSSVKSAESRREQSESGRIQKCTKCKNEFTIWKNAGRKNELSNLTIVSGGDTTTTTMKKKNASTITNARKGGQNDGTVNTTHKQT